MPASSGSNSAHLETVRLGPEPSRVNAAASTVVSASARDRPSGLGFKARGPGRDRKWTARNLGRTDGMSFEQCHVLQPRHPLLFNVVSRAIREANAAGQRASGFGSPAQCRTQQRSRKGKSR